MRNSVLPRTHRATGALYPRSFIRVGQCGCSGVTSSAPNHAADRNAISTAPVENFGITRSLSERNFSSSIDSLPR